MDDFNQILLNLMRPENEFRTNAESVYERISPRDKLQYLFISICDDNQTEEVRHFAAILMRRVLFNAYEELVRQANDTFFVELKTHTLNLLQKENITLRLRKKVCDIASELAKYYIDDDGNNLWPELLNFLFTAANSPNLELRECALILFASHSLIFGNNQVKYLDYIKKMLLKSLCEESNNAVKLAALKATCAFILNNYEDKAIVKMLSETTLPMLQIMNTFIELDDDEPLLQIIELAEKCPQLLRSNFTTLMELCLKTLTNAELSDKLKFSALEIIVSYAETAPSSVRKRGSQYLVPLVSHLLMMMTDIEEDPNWTFNENEDDEQDADSNNIIGETSLDRLACALGGKTIFPIAIGIISAMLRDADWKKRYAALMAISSLGEGCHKQMLPMLDQVVHAILPYVTDPHPRVRYAICNAFGQMASDFGPNFEELFHDKFIPNMLMLLDDSQNPRVQAHAAAAFVNFFEEANQKILLNYVPSIAQKFEEVLKCKMEELVKKGTKLVLEQIVVSISSLADVVQEVFINYYERFMPCLKFIIENANVKELRLLRGKAIECASLIGLAVGSEKFCSDASDIMNLLLRTQTGEVVLEDDDPQLSYMITSWVRICKLLGEKFEPYLPLVMPQVLKTASLNIEMTILDQECAKALEDNTDWQCISINDQQNLGIKVAGLEDKATACEMLVCYARELKHGFVNYIEDTVKILVPLLKFYFHEGVRTAAAQSPPYLLECAKMRGEGYVLEIWKFIFGTLLSAIENESDRSILSEMLISTADCITTLGVRALNEEQMQELIKVLDTHLKEHFDRFKERQAKRDDEDYDDDIEEMLNDEDDDDVYTLSKIVDVLHSLFVVYGDKFLPFFNQLFKHIISLATPDRPPSDQQWSLCVIDDLIEFCGVKCIEYKDFFLPLLSNNLKSPHTELRQAASYGFGVLAKHGGDTFAKVLADNLPNLVAIIQEPNSRLAENVTATENAIAAITKIIEFNHSMIDVDSVLPVWLTWLPIWEDEEEVIYVYSFLYKLLESNHPLILGVDNCNVPRIVAVILEVFARNVIEHPSELGQKLIAYIKFVNVDSNISSTFSLEQRQALEQIKAN